MPTTPPPTVAPEPLGERVLAVLAASEPLLARDIARQLGVRRREVTKLLKGELSSAVRRVGANHWSLKKGDRAAAGTGIADSDAVVPARRKGSQPSREREPRPPTLPRAKGEAERILEAWTALEALSTQGFVLPEDLTAGDSRRIASLGNRRLPWEVPANPPAKQRLWYQVVLGELRLDRAYAALLEKYADERPDRPTPKPRSLLAVAVCDSEGVPQVDRATVSSLAWGLPLALTGDLGRLGQWPQEEGRLAGELTRRLVRRDEGGRRLPLDREWMAELYEWLVKRLGLAAELVAPPTFAIRQLQYTFVKEPPEPLLLNSFFVRDLGRARELFAQEKAPTLLRRYLGVQEPEAARDVLQDGAALAGLLSPALIPPARWPGRGRRPLVALQQAAVNAAASGAAGTLAAVNGPPGTGKTTLLRDLVAAVVTARAEALARFDEPERAFTATGVRFSRAGAQFELRSVASELRGFEIVVASSNNRAVENVSAELPGIDAIAEDLPELRYFSSVASAVRGQPCWGLIAAVLGNNSNVYEFQQAFWKDEDRGLESYLATAAGTPRRIQDPAGGEPREPRVVSEERPPFGRVEALERWRAARLRFTQAVAASRSALAERQRIEALEGEVRTLNERIATYPELLRSARAEESLAREAAQAEGVRAAVADEALRAAQTACAAHAEARPGWVASLLHRPQAASWEERARELRVRQDEAERESRVLRERQLGAERRALEAGGKAEALNASAEADERRLADARRALASASAALGAPTGFQLSRLPHAERQLATPWLDEAAQRLRDETFVAALQLHRAFIDAAAAPIRHNLASLARHLWTGVPEARPEHVRDLWATFALVVPVVSTTFASVEKMFRGLWPLTLGWLLIDEAGQATPQAAVGALLRAQRAVVVGDPMQIEPVVELPAALVRSLVRHFEVPPERYAAPEVSAQVLADRASPFVATFEVREGARRVGLPLLVHRRCAEPMFAISNALAYDNLMVKATPARSSPIGDLLGPSRWFDVAGAGESHYCPAEGELLLKLLRRLANAGVAPDLYVVTPFRAVAQRTRQLVRSAPDLARLWPDLGRMASERIGTVHTVQGREAEAVILVLGAPEPSQQGARVWAGQSPNLLNVAVTRAKERLYVIGNRSLWRSAGYFRVLDERLRHHESAASA